MIIATITLIIMLLGGPTQTFLIDKFEKGVKKSVIDKARKKEILKDLKASEKKIKSFNKERKARLKKFRVINADRNTNREDLITFFDRSMEKRLAYQETIIEDRIAITSKITAEEWESILKFAKGPVEKRLKKMQKKQDKKKGRELYPKTRAAIGKVVDQGKRNILSDGLDQMISVRWVGPNDQ